MQEIHSGSTSRWRHAADNGTLRRTAAPAKGACRLDRGRIHLPVLRTRVTHPKNRCGGWRRSVCARGSIPARHP